MKPPHLHVFTLVVLTTILTFLTQQVSGSKVSVTSWSHCPQIKQDVIHVDQFSLSRETDLPGDVVFSALLDVKQNTSAPIGINFRLYTKIWIIFFPIWQEVDCKRLGGSCWYPNVCTEDNCPVSEGLHDIDDYHYKIAGEVPSRTYYIELKIQAHRNSRIPYTCYGVYFDVTNSEGFLDYPDENLVSITAAGLLITIALLVLIFLRIRNETEIRYAVLA